MRLRDKVNDDLMAAMKARETTRLSTLRMMKSAFKNKEIELRAELNDGQAIDVLKTLVKQGQESIEQFKEGGREDLASKEADEIRVIEEYLPAAVSDEEIERIVEEVVRESGASSPKDIGPVMKQCMARFAGRLVDGRKVNAAVQRRLATS